jgi:hypothetical protein
MFQVLTTIFFSATITASSSVIAAMLSDNQDDIRAALGIGSRSARRVIEHRGRRTRTTEVRAKPATVTQPLRAAA